jgi:hypothetical protein
MEIAFVTYMLQFLLSKHHQHHEKVLAEEGNFQLQSIMKYHVLHRGDNDADSAKELNVRTYVYIYVYIYIYIHIYIHIYVNKYTFMYTHIYICIETGKKLFFN